MFGSRGANVFELSFEFVILRCKGFFLPRYLVWASCLSVPVGPIAILSIRSHARVFCAAGAAGRVTELQSRDRQGERFSCDACDATLAAS